jgi:glycerol-3-phosphate acyltransferase PlsY
MTHDGLGFSIMPTWLALVGAYLIGSLDFAVVVARAHGVDIHSVGSGNPGTSNVLRTLGRGPAAMVLLGDALKGVIAAAIGWLAVGAGDPANEPIAFAAGFLAVLGHCYPIMHRFKGGKGVATSAGVLLFTLPVAAFILAAVWALIAKVFKVASIASLVAVAMTIPLALWQGTSGAALLWLAAIIVLVVARHAPNIRRMISGSEQRVPT